MVALDGRLMYSRVSGGVSNIDGLSSNEGEPSDAPMVRGEAQVLDAFRVAA
jgi:hypothetical protein